MTKKNLLLVLVILISAVILQAQEWAQIGGDIDGEAAGDQSGWSVSLNSDGNIVAIGANSNDGNGNASGHVRVYGNQKGGWVQIGDDIDGESTGDESGTSVSLNDDGTIVAIGDVLNDANGENSGQVRVFENQNGSWVQIGDDIDGEEGGLGHSVSLSSHGTILAAGAHYNDGKNGYNSGHVRVYGNLSGNWTQIGDDIDGEAREDYSGWSVSLSSDGTVVAIGAPNNDGNGNWSGHVRVYKCIGGNWIQLWNDINGEVAGDQSGLAVSLNSDGSVLAIGAHYNDGNGSNSGHVRVYKCISGSWVQTGDDINGEAAGDESGWSVNLNSDGSVLAIGAYLNDGNGSSSGHVRLYKNQNGNWVQVGSDIDGEATNDQSGWAVSLSSDGTVVAIGARYNDGNGSNAGHVRVYKFPFPAIMSQPAGYTATCIGKSIDIAVTAENAASYQWQLSTDNGNKWSGITDGDVYRGTSTTTLTISEMTADMDKFQYRCIASNILKNDTSDAAIISIETELPEPDVATLDNVTDECEVTALTTPTATDNCAGTITTVHDAVLPITTQGTTIITWTYDDGNGNTATQTQNVVIKDLTAPVPDVETLNDITAECEVTTLTVPTATDNCTGKIMATHDISMPITASGTTVVTWIYDDGNGNTFAQTQNVVIKDVTKPTITCVGDTNVDAGTTNTYTISGAGFDATVNDNCRVESVVNSYNNTSTLTGEELSPGSYTINWSATDIAGNTAERTMEILVGAPTGLQAIQGINAQVYPNPTTGIVHVQNATGCQIRVTDICGRELETKDINSDNVVVDLTKNKRGVYFIQFVNSDVAGIFKVVKE